MWSGRNVQKILRTHQNSFWFRFLLSNSEQHRRLTLTIPEFPWPMNLLKLFFSSSTLLIWSNYGLPAKTWQASVWGWSSSGVMVLELTSGHPPPAEKNERIWGWELNASDRSRHTVCVSNTSDWNKMGRGQNQKSCIHIPCTVFTFIFKK